MTDATAQADDAPPPGSSKMPLILFVILLLGGAGGGFFAVSAGIVPIKGANPAGDTPHLPAADMPDVAYVDIPTMIVTLPPGATHKHLRFTAKIEVPTAFRSDVEHLLPRIQDLLNGYLRALSAEDIEGAGSIFELRMQMLHRIVVAVGLGKVNGLMITEFILN